LQEASEETKLRLQLAEAERAKAEADLARIRAEAAAKTAAPPPAATSPAPAQATPSTPPPPASSPAPPTALTYTGGFAQNECAGNDQDDAPTTSRSPFRIVDGEIVISAGVPGRAGSMLIRGRPGPNGELTLNGSVVGRGRGRNMTLPAFYQGQIVKGRGLLKGRIGQRPCTILLQLK
jgi:hypothetical protein